MNLKELRKAAGLRQWQVGAHLDIDQSAVCHWERGHGKPMRKHRKRLARLYGVSEEALAAAIAETKVAQYFNTTVDELLGSGEVSG